MKLIPHYLLPEPPLFMLTVGGSRSASRSLPTIAEFQARKGSYERSTHIATADHWLKRDKPTSYMELMNAFVAFIEVCDSSMHEGDERHERLMKYLEHEFYRNHLPLKDMAAIAEYVRIHPDVNDRKKYRVRDANTIMAKPDTCIREAMATRYALIVEQREAEERLRIHTQAKRNIEQGSGLPDWVASQDQGEVQQRGTCYPAGCDLSGPITSRRSLRGCPSWPKSIPELHDVPPVVGNPNWDIARPPPANASAEWMAYNYPETGGEYGSPEIGKGWGSITNPPLREPVRMAAFDPDTFRNLFRAATVHDRFTLSGGRRAGLTTGRLGVSEPNRQEMPRTEFVRFLNPLESAARYMSMYGSTHQTNEPQMREHVSAALERLYMVGVSRMYGGSLTAPRDQEARLTIQALWESLYNEPGSMSAWRHLASALVAGMQQASLADLRQPWEHDPMDLLERAGYRLPPGLTREQAHATMVNPRVGVTSRIQYTPEVREIWSDVVSDGIRGGNMPMRRESHHRNVNAVGTVDGRTIPVHEFEAISFRVMTEEIVSYEMDGMILTQRWSDGTEEVTRVDPGNERSVIEAIERRRMSRGI